ncbi:MAG: hypothetical protein H6850_02495 [Alphaproteobacteria bacterium]|nr:MAG: hypothetical protein H6850_02495 [Alphaproteobacteria bacterium]
MFLGTGFDWFVAVMGGAATVDVPSKEIKATEEEITLPGGAKTKPEVTFGDCDYGKLPLLLLSGGISWQQGKIHAKAEIAGNAAAFLKSDVKDLGQVKFGIGYEVMNKLVASFIFGAQMRSMNKINMKASAKAPKFEDKAVYLSDSNNLGGESPHADKFYNGFAGVELKYKVMNHIHVVGAYQYGIGSSTLKKDLYLRADEEFDLTAGKADKNQRIQNITVNEIKSKTNHKVSVGILVESGGLL